jgi:hypothetical protein
LVLDIADDSPRVAAGSGRNELPERLDLYAWSARFRGEELQYDRSSKSVSHFVRAETFPNELWWYNYGALDGEYNVEVTYSCENTIAGSSYRIGIHTGNQEPYFALSGQVEGTGGRFVTRTVEGILKIGPDDQHISFGLPADEKSAGIRVQKITLIRRAG